MAQKRVKASSFTSCQCKVYIDSFRTFCTESKEQTERIHQPGLWYQGSTNHRKARRAKTSTVMFRERGQALALSDQQIRRWPGEEQVTYGFSVTSSSVRQTKQIKNIQNRIRSLISKMTTEREGCVFL